MDEIMKNNLTVRDYIMIIEVLESAVDELERQALRNGYQSNPSKVEQLKELIERIKGITT